MDDMELYTTSLDVDDSVRNEAKILKSDCITFELPGGPNFITNYGEIHQAAFEIYHYARTYAQTHARLDKSDSISPAVFNLGPTILLGSIYSLLSCSLTHLLSYLKYT